MAKNPKLRGSNTTIRRTVEGKSKSSGRIVLLHLVFAASGPTQGESSKVKIPEPKSFGGTRSAKELQNFICDIEQYFTTAGVAESDKFNITTMYLVGDAKLWWRNRNAEDD